MVSEEIGYAATRGRVRRAKNEPSKPVAGELLFGLAAGHVTLLHSVLGLARIEVVIADSKGIGAG